MEQNNEHISEQHQPGTQNVLQSESITKPLGEVMTTALTCGVIGAVLTIILALIGWYDGLDSSLKEYYMAEPFYMPEPVWTAWYSVWDMMMVVVLTFGVSFAVLDTDKKWRRVMIILLLSVVVILASPVLMLWDVFWSPVTVFVGVLWSWICAFIYSCQHTMPCELLLPTPLLQDKKVEPDIFPMIDQKKSAEEKYQPKEQSSCPD